MVKKILCIAAAIAASGLIQAKTINIKVKNNLDFQRRELVELAVDEVCSRIGVVSVSAVIVRDALGQEVAHQITHDGKLLFEASVAPNGSALYSVEEAGLGGFEIRRNRQYRSYTYGQVWAERLDDLTWENDLGVYRMYGPALQRTGERSFGTDLWTKSTPYLDVEKRYKAEFAVRDTLKRLREQGLKDEAKRIENSISYHIDHGTGYDAYGVGPTLGCGAPALISNGRLVMPYCWESCQVLDNGPLRFTVALTYGPKTVGKDKNVVEHRLVSLDKGSHYNRMTVWYDGLTEPYKLASGVVIHSADTTSIELGADCALYADPTDRPQKLSQQVYVGTIYPSGNVETMFIPFDGQADGVAGHAVGVTEYKSGDRFTYYFGSAWSGYDVRTWQEWKLRSHLYTQSLRSPLVVEWQ